MLLSQVIHVLELITAVLFAALGRQLFVCYRDFVTHGNVVDKTTSTQGTIEEPVLDAVIKVAPVQIKQQAANSDVAVPEMKLAQAPAKESPAPSEDILTDYIGGFFESAEPSSVDITEFKAPIPEKVVQPIVQDDELEEDSIITVAEEAVVPGANKIMSEKVVHAMLDEAKLVCNS